MNKLAPVSKFKLRKVVVTRLTKSGMTQGLPSTSILQTGTSVVE